MDLTVTFSATSSGMGADEKYTLMLSQEPRPNSSVRT